jgi:hypothetical protein
VPTLISLSSRQRELLNMSTIASQMPVAFSNGAAWEEFKGECNICGKELNDAHVLGVVKRSTPHVAVIEAIGVCGVCRVATPFDYRLYDDMRITGLREDGWKTWMPKRSILERMLDLLCFRN